jgi:hypothetical protein
MDVVVVFDQTKAIEVRTPFYRPMFSVCTFLISSIPIAADDLDE